MGMSLFQLVQQLERVLESVGLLNIFLLSIVWVVGVQTFLLRKSHHLPPGPRPWPIVGNLLIMGKAPHQKLTTLAKQYGHLMYLRLGSVHTLVASSPTMAKEFLKTQDHVFQYRPPIHLAKITSNNWTLAILSGSKWRYVRKICMNELFTTKQLQSFQPLRTKEIQATIKDIYKEAQEGKVVDMQSTLSSFTTNHMTQLLFGKRFVGAGINKKEAQWFKETIASIFHWAGAFIVADFIPYLKWVTKFQGIDAIFHKLRIEISAFISKMIDEHRKAPLNGHSSTHDTSKDFLDVLLATSGEDGIGCLPDGAIQDIIMDMFLGGTGSIAGTVEWAISLLLLQPNLMKHAQAELDNVVGTSRLVEESDIQHLPYIQAIIKETLRLYPVAPLLLPHHSLEASQVEGYTIPANTRVIVNLYAIGRDPNVWENPFEFDPNRFIQHPKIDVLGNDFNLIPFGSGRRGCPGRPLGMLMVQIMLARLLQSFDWSLPNQQHDLDMSEKFGLDLKRAQPLRVMPNPRLLAHFYQ